jgi:hypothetical protein
MFGIIGYRISSRLAWVVSSKVLVREILGADGLVSTPMTVWDRTKHEDSGYAWGTMMGAQMGGMRVAAIVMACEHRFLGPIAWDSARSHSTLGQDY